MILKDACWHDAVKVEVIEELLIPGMQDRDEAELTLHAPLWVSGEGLEGVADGGEQEVEQGVLVAEDQGVQLMGESEDDMEVADGDEFVGAVLKPEFLGESLTLWAVTVSA